MIRPLLLSLLVTGIALGGDEPVEEAAIPGQTIVKSDSEDVILDLLDSIEDITGTDSASVLNRIPNLNLYIIDYPFDIPPQDTDEIEQRIQDAIDDGQLEWGEANLTVDNANGQTDSLWVSGLGIDENGFRNQYALELLDIDTAHQSSQGEGVLVAIIDTGVDTTHPAIANCISPNGYNFINQLLSPNDAANKLDDDNDGLIDEMVGHGTFLAGLVNLVAPNSRFLPVTVLNSDGVGSSATVAQGITYAVDQGAQVLLLALGTQARTETIASAVEYARSNGATVVSPVGNGGKIHSLHPASEPTVISVGGSTHLDELGDYSNDHEAIDVCGPGSSEIINGTPTPNRCVIGPRPGGGYFAAEGTSFSTAFVAGTAALIRAQHPEWPNSSIPRKQISNQVAGTLVNSTINVNLPLNNQLRPRIHASEATGFGYPVPSQCDLNGDGKVNSADLGLALASWGDEYRPTGGLHLSDINCDFKVYADDIGLILSSWSN